MQSLSGNLHKAENGRGVFAVRKIAFAHFEWSRTKG